jgi:hypothetical protein
MTVLLSVVILGIAPYSFSIARVQYGGGGDWYSDPSSLPNLLRAAHEWAHLDVAPRESVVRLTDPELFSFPYLYMTGHGNASLSPAEVGRLRRYLVAGGFLHADDNYGMDQSFRREMAKVFPDKELEEVPFDHDVYAWPFRFPAGLPKIHEHHGGPPAGLGYFHEGRLVVFYSYNTDLGDGWEDPEVHGDPPEKREAALRMGVNLLCYALTH